MNLEHIGTSTYNDLITIFKLHLLYSLCGFLVIDNYEELMCHQLLSLKWPNLNFFPFVKSGFYLGRFG